MARHGTAVSGKSLDFIQGLPALRLSRLRYIVRRTALTVLAVLGLGVGLTATYVAANGVPNADVISEAPGGVVTDVGPTGFAWTSGLRVGQRVLYVGDASAGEWWMETTDGSAIYRADELVATNALRNTAPAGLVALASGGLALLFLNTRRRWVVPTASVALLAASIPLVAQGEADTSTAILGAAALVPGVAYALRLPRRFGLRWLGILGVAAVLGAWAEGRIAGSSDPPFDAARSGLAALGTLALCLERSALPAVTTRSLRLLRPRLFDVAVAAVLATATIVVTFVFHLPILVTLLVPLLILAMVPALRRRVGRQIEDILLADIRQRAAAEATELERARLARELHDVPLQELVAVIRRLEIKPGTESESEDLRALAGHLRNVATELRPPVLDDLGLSAALDFLAEQASTTALPVSAAIDDATGFGPDRRPPTDVELAMYRIASEAVGNAVRHSGGSKVTIAASVAPDRVELSIIDDGAGLASEAARDAAKRKRLGLSSMRRRAEAIDAELSIEGSSRGTRVRVVWQA